MNLNKTLTTLNNKKLAAIVIRDIKELNTYHLLNDEEDIIHYINDVLSEVNSKCNNSIYKLVFNYLTTK